MATGITGTTPTASTTTSKQPASLTQGPGGALGKDQFLKLLVAQMKHQDPMNPMDGSQMAAQLAQFSSVEQLTQINESLQTQQTGQTGLATLLANNGALGSVGKQVVVAASGVDTTKGSPSAVQADIPTEARSARLKILDENGAEVASQDLGVVSGGRRTFNLGDATKQLPGGTYSYVVETTSTAGAVEDAATFVSGRVDGVRFTPKGPVVTLGGPAVSYMAVTEVSD
jgi:flagellar basal-body rod modification protein FlgD